MKTVRILRPTLLARMLWALMYGAGICVLQFWLPFGIPIRYNAVIVPVLAIFGAVGLADLFLRQIVLYEDRLKVVSAWHLPSRIIARPEIDIVTWEKAAGASLRMRDGSWVGLPNVGLTPQSVTAIIQAWLKRRNSSRDDRVA